MIVALNAATSATQTTYTLSNAGPSGGTVTPYLANAANNTAAQSAIPLTGSSFAATVPPRSLVTYRITS